MPEDVLRAHTVRVVIHPDLEEPLDHPNANAAARESVDKALMDWGRFELVPEGEESDLVIAVRTGNGNRVRPTVQGGPLDQRPGVAQGTDGGIRIGAQQGQAPPLNNPGMGPQDRRPHIGNEVGPSDDLFEVYRSRGEFPLDGPAVWRYVAKDCLQEPKVAAVDAFRKAVADAEKPHPAKKP